MSATIHHLRPVAVDTREDPWHAVLGHPPHRETFPLWERQPADIQAWLKASQEEFPIFGFCQATQGIPLGKLIESWREEEEASRELLAAYIGLHRRHALMARALHGEAMRLGLAAVYNHFGRPANSAELEDLASLNGRAI